MRRSPSPWPRPRGHLFGLLLGASLLLPGLARAQNRRTPHLLGPPPTSSARIVTLAPSITEIVIALGASNKLVGVSRFDDFPEVKGLTRVGGFVDPNLETILSLRPDLVFVVPSPGNEEVVRALVRLGVSVRVVYGSHLSELWTQIRTLGEDLHRPQEATALIAHMNARLAALARARPAGPRPGVVALIGRKPLVVAGPSSLVGELLEKAGANNLVPLGPSPYPVYPLEALMKLQADWILDFSGGPAAAPDNSGGSGALSHLAATRRGHLRPLGDTSLLRPGPKIVDAVEAIADLLREDRIKAAPSSTGNPGPRSTSAGKTP